MQNDMLKNTIAPWQEKGRWYHAAYDYSTEKFIAEETDSLLLDLTIFETYIAGNLRYMYSKNDDYQITDCKIIPRGKLTVANTITNVAVGQARIFSATAPINYFGIAIALIPTYVSAGITDIWFFITQN